jgi:hypothetical protein
MSKAGGAPDPEGVNMGRVGAEQEVPAAPELDPAIIDFTANTMYPKGKMRLMERDWILDDENTALLPRDEIRMRDLMPGDFMQSKDGNTIWQVVAVRGGEEFGLEPGRIKIYRRNIESGELTTYEHFHGVRLDGVRRAINPSDLNIPEGSEEIAINDPAAFPDKPEGDLIAINDPVKSPSKDKKKEEELVAHYSDVDIPQAQAGAAAAKLNITKDGDRFLMEVVVYDQDGKEVYRAEGSYRTREGAEAEGKALLHQFAAGVVAQKREEQGDVLEARATDVPVSRGDVPNGADNAPEQIEVDNLPNETSGKIQITSVYGKEPKFEAEAVVQDRDGEVVANQTSEHGNKKAAETEGRDFIARVIDALMNPEKPEEPSKPSEPSEPKKPSKPRKERELTDGEKAVIKNNAWVEENAGSLQPTPAEEIQVGDFIWNGFFGRFEEVLSVKYAGVMNRMEFQVFNVQNDKQETRYFEMDSPLRNVRRPGVEDQAVAIPSAKAAPRGGKRNVIKRKPLSERIIAKEGRKMGGNFGKEGFFKDMNGVPLVPGDVVLHKDPIKGGKWKRGVVKLRKGAQVEEGKKAGAVPRKGVAYLDYLVVQWEGEDDEYAIKEGGRQVKAKNLAKFDGSIDGMVMPEFRGGNVKPNTPEAKPVAEQQRLVEVEKPEPKPPVVNPAMPQSVYKAEVKDKAGKKYNVSVINIDGVYEAAVFTEDNKLNAVIGKNTSFGEVQGIVGRFIDDIANAPDGDTVVRLYGDLPDPAEQLAFTRETAEVPELPNVKSIDLKTAKVRAKDLAARVAGKEIPGEDVLKVMTASEQERVKRYLQEYLSPSGVDRRQNGKFNEEMANAYRYAVRLGWYDEAREIIALQRRVEAIPLRPMDDGFNIQIDALKELQPKIANIETELARRVGWGDRKKISGLMEAINNAVVNPDIYNPNFRNAIIGGKNAIDSLVESLENNPAKDDRSQELADQLKEFKKYFDDFGDLPKLPARNIVDADEQTKHLAEIARDFEGMSIDQLRNGVGDWKFEKALTAGINKVYLLRNALTGERIVIKFDNDHGDKVNGVFAGNGIKAEEMVAALYKDLGFAQPAFKAINPEDKNVEIGGVGIMEYADTGFFGLANIDTHHQAGVFRIDRVAPEHRAELLNFLVANAIIGNSDRHGGNFMWGFDPVSGLARLVPIDNGLAIFNGGFGKAEANVNNPLYLDPIKIILGSYGNQNQVGKFAKGWIQEVGEEEAKNQVVEFATRMRERAAALEFVDARANEYLTARADYILSNPQKFIDAILRNW